MVKIKFEWIKEIVKRGFLTIPLNVFEQISNSIGRFFIERWVGLSQLGIYGHSLYYQKAFMFPHRAFNKTYVPGVLGLVSQKNKDQKEIARLRGILKKWFGLLALAGVFVALFSREAIDILTHGKFTEAAPLVSLWFLIIVIYAFGVPYTQYLLAHKKNKFIFRSQIIIGIISWAIIALFVKLFGIIGATVAVLLYFFTLHFTRKMYAHRQGCFNFEGPFFWLTTAAITFFIILSDWLIFSLPVKIIIFIVISFIIFIVYDLYSLSLEMFRKLKDVNRDFWNR